MFLDSPDPEGLGYTKQSPLTRARICHDNGRIGWAYLKVALQFRFFFMEDRLD